MALRKVDSTLRKKAHRLIANYLMRYYTDNTTKRFRTWKELTQKQDQREKIMRRMVEHWKRHQFAQVKAAFKTFISQEK